MSKTGKQVTTQPSTPQFQEFNEPNRAHEDDAILDIYATDARK